MANQQYQSSKGHIKIFKIKKQQHTIQIRQRGTSLIFNWRSRSNTFVFRLCMTVSGLKLQIKK